MSGLAWVAAAAGALAIATALLAPRGRVPLRRVGPELDLRDEDLPARAAAVAGIDDVARSGDGSPVLLGQEFLGATLRGRIAVARRALRPMSVVHVEVLVEPGHTPVAAHLVASAAEMTLRESDIVGRRDDGVYVFILEDTGEDGAVWTIERLRRSVVGAVGHRRFHAGVASYPNHGLDAEAIDRQAAKALRAAREWDRDRIEVATTR